MKVKAFIQYKTKDLLQCTLLIKRGKIQEAKLPSFDNQIPYMNNSLLSTDIKIEKHYDSKSAPKKLKYFIKKSLNDEVLIMYLDISYIEYLKLKWQLNELLVQSKEFKIGLILTILGAILAYYTNIFSK